MSRSYLNEQSHPKRFWRRLSGRTGKHTVPTSLRLRVWSVIAGVVEAAIATAAKSLEPRELASFEMTECRTETLDSLKSWDETSAMIKNPEIYRRRAEDLRWGTLQRMSPEESIAIGEALLTSEIMKVASFARRRRPKCLAIALGLEPSFRSQRK